jgi:hypothetical protein
LLTSARSKRTGLDKAIHQVAEAIKRAKVDAPANEAAVADLQRLLDAAHVLPSAVERNVPEYLDDADNEDSPMLPSPGDQLTLDDAENPLQLLARASGLEGSSRPQASLQSEYGGSPETLLVNTNDSSLQNFFLPIKSTLDIGGTGNGDDVDPIDAGLVTIEEAETLIA